MKIRTGFVSNSSSSSYCIMGTGDTAITSALARACGYLGVTPDGEGDPQYSNGFPEGVFSLYDFVMHEPNDAWSKTISDQIRQNPELEDPFRNIRYTLAFVSSEPQDYMEVGFEFPDHDDLCLGEVRRAFIRFCNSLDIHIEPDTVHLCFGEVSS